MKVLFGLVFGFVLGNMIAHRSHRDDQLLEQVKESTERARANLQELTSQIHKSEELVHAAEDKLKESRRIRENIRARARHRPRKSGTR